MASVPAPGSALNDHGPSEVTTLLGRGSEFEGKLSFEGTVRIDGKLAGEIFSDDVLIVGEGAEVSAEIDATLRQRRLTQVRAQALTFLRSRASISALMDIGEVFARLR